MDETSKIIVNQSSQIYIMKRQIDKLQSENELQSERIAQLVEALEKKYSQRGGMIPTLRWAMQLIQINWKGVLGDMADNLETALKAAKGESE